MSANSKFLFFATCQYLSMATFMLYMKRTGGADGFVILGLFGAFALASWAMEHHKKRNALPIGYKTHNVCLFVFTIALGFIQT
jgi:hypothetical protein